MDGGMSFPGAGTEPPRRQVDLQTFALSGLIPAAILDTVRFFETSDRDSIAAALLDEAGRPWAHSFESAWANNQDEARKKALFDLVWHRRARELDPMVTARGFAGFDVLLDAARQVAPELATMLGRIDPHDHGNVRRQDGPDWWQAWHDSNGTASGGWLTLDEVDAVWRQWPLIMTDEVEQSCLEAMGASYTHAGCWALLNDLGGFFAQCSSERRAVLSEVDA